jgi:hypothetical protein
VTTALFQGAISAISFSAMLVMFASVIGLVWWLCSTVFAIVAHGSFAPVTLCSTWAAPFVKGVMSKIIGV